MQPSRVEPARSFAVAALRVLLIDEHEMLRAGLQASLASESSLQVVGAVGSMDEALKAIATLQPAIIVTEVTAGGGSVAELLASLAATGAPVRVLVLTSEAAEAPMRQAMKAGARAYLVKEDGYSDLLQALREVAAGKRYFSDSVESLILAQYVERIAARFASGEAPITPREREVLTRIGQGQTNKAIARALSLSVKTVEKHRANLMRKLGLHNTAAVTVYAIRQGLVSENSPRLDR